MDIVNIFTKQKGTTHNQMYTGIISFDNALTQMDVLFCVLFNFNSNNQNRSLFYARNQEFWFDRN